MAIGALCVLGAYLIAGSLKMDYAHGGLLVIGVQILFMAREMDKR